MKPVYIVFAGDYPEDETTVGVCMTMEQAQAIENKYKNDCNYTYTEVWMPGPDGGKMIDNT